MTSDRVRRLVAESLGTGLLLFVVVGSGLAVEQLGVDGVAALLAHAVAVGLGLGAFIAVLAPVSGAHFNPAVTLGFRIEGAIGSSDAIAYVIAQLTGAIAGVVAANASFGDGLATVSDTTRTGAGLVGAELVATFVLALLILGLVRAGSGVPVVAAGVGAWVATAIVATSSGGFANPAVTVARTLMDSFTGIAPASVPPFVVAQLIGGAVAAAAAVYLFPSGAERSAEPTVTEGERS